MALRKDQLEKKVAELEEQLHQEQNSSEYWSHEYYDLLGRYEELQLSVRSNPILKSITGLSLTQRMQVDEFLANLR